MNNRFTATLTAVLAVVMVAVLIFCLVECGSMPNDTESMTPSNSGVVSLGPQDSTDPDHSSNGDGSTPDTPSVPSNSTDSTESSEEPKPVDQRMHLLACPDNIIHASVYYDAVNVAAKKNNTTPVYKPLDEIEYDFSEIYKNVADHIAKADLAYINVETMMGGDELGISSYPTFNTPEACGHTLIDLGFDVFNIAHNHMLDAGIKGLQGCNRFFTEKGKTVLGYYANAAATNNITVTETNGIRIAWLTYTYGTNGLTKPASADEYIPYFDEQLIRAQVAAAREVSDLIIVSAHWGDENADYLDRYQKQYSKLFLELDIDIVLGMHSHNIQPMRWETNASGGRTLMIYSLGNFISGMQDHTNMLGGMLDLEIVKSAETGEITLENIIFTPVVTYYTSGKRVGSYLGDTGQRNYCIYPLCDFTEDLLNSHGIKELKSVYKLVGGEWSIECLYKTVQKYIDPEFLEEKYRASGD